MRAADGLCSYSNKHPIRRLHPADATVWQMQAATPDLFSNRVKTTARLASQKVGSIAISLVSASREELRRCTCDPNSALQQAAHHAVGCCNLNCVPFHIGYTAFHYVMLQHVTCNMLHDMT